jgi:hypothetical protein
VLTSKWTVVGAVISLAATAAGARQELLPVGGDTAPVHDPAAIKEKQTDLMFFHAYFGEGRGRGSALQISTLAWQDGWPRAGVLP